MNTVCFFLFTLRKIYIVKGCWKFLLDDEEIKGKNSDVWLFCQIWWSGSAKNFSTATFQHILILLYAILLNFLTIDIWILNNKNNNINASRVKIINHIEIECRKWAKEENKRKHEWVGRVIFQELYKSLRFDLWKSVVYEQARSFPRE